MDDRSGAIKYSYPFLAFFSTLFVLLRVGNNIRNKKFWYLNVSDWLLVLAQVSNRRSMFVDKYDLTMELGLRFGRGKFWSKIRMGWSRKTCLGPVGHKGRPRKLLAVPLVRPVLQPDFDGSAQV